jgi:G patch domain-containing protein 1
MTTDARREARKAMMALAPDVASKKVYGADLPQGFQHESAQTSEENFPMEEDEAEIDVPSSIPIFVINPKKDLHGLGFDPYKNAPEFRGMLLNQRVESIMTLFFLLL